MPAKKALTITSVAALVAVFLTAVAFVLSLFFVVARGHTLDIPLLINYTSTSSSMTIEPSGSLYVVTLALFVLALPLVWWTDGRSRSQ